MMEFRRRGTQTPYLVMDGKAVERAARTVGAGIPGSEAYYAVKANDTLDVLRILVGLDYGFEVASTAELESVVRMGVPPWKLISSSPVKTDAFIRDAYQLGIRQFVVDCEDEADKVARIIPGVEVCIRLSISNEFSQWPLSGKFGVEADRVVPLALYATRLGLKAVGTTFHVGSQCTHIEAWTGALKQCAAVWNEARANGLSFTVLNMGGGYPVRYREPVPSVPDIEKAAAAAIQELYPKGTRVQLEPGRYIVGEAGLFVSTCVAKAKRDGTDWLFLDLGVYNGLMESIAGIKYRFSVEGGGPVKTWTIAGPTCDGFDVVDRGVELPEPAVGQTVFVHSAGAYTTVYASNFNGFPYPRILLEGDSLESSERRKE